MAEIIERVYDKMFPSSMQGLPGYSLLESPYFVTHHQHVQLLNELVIAQHIDIEKIEVNQLLSAFKKYARQEATDFIEQATRMYFTHPQVLAVIQQGRVTLHPHQRVLPEIDFDLLIPVIEKEDNNAK